MQSPLMPIEGLGIKNKTIFTQMRGSLNVTVRKNEMIRINEGNIAILNKLRSIKPRCGDFESWKKHEAKSVKLRKHI
jgi:hypothetical protein